MTVVADIFDDKNICIGNIIKVGGKYTIEWVGTDPDPPIKFRIISRIPYNSLELAENEVSRIEIVNRVTRRTA